MTSAVQLADLASDPALVVDGSQRVLAFNAAAQELLGWSAADAIGRTCSEVVGSVLADGTELCNHNCAGMSGFADCRPYSVSECFAHRADGTRVAVQISSLAIPRDVEDPDASVAVILLRRSVAHDPEPVDGKFCLHTLGTFSASNGGLDLMVDQWARKQAVQVLKYLAVRAGHPVHREELVELLWPDSDDEKHARQRLKVAVHFLRSRLRDAGLPDDLVATEGSTYTLDARQVWIDAKAFEHHAAEGRAHERGGRDADAIREYEEARRLYRGDFFEADRYADWCAEERARLSEIHLDVLIRLAGRLVAKGDHAAAAQICHAALVVEPCREGIHRTLIRCLIAMQRKDRALAQFRRCRRVLLDELGIELSPETRQLVEEFADLKSAGAR